MGTAFLSKSNGLRGKMEIVWENASPTSSFAAQAVSVDLSEYKIVLIQFSFNVSSATYVWWNIPVGKGGQCTMASYPSDGFTVVCRYATVGTASVSFGKDTGKIFGSSSDTTINGTEKYMIPVAIYGIK